LFAGQEVTVLAAASGQYFPMGQGVQTVLDDTVHAEVRDWPLEHARQALQMAAFCEVEKVVPASQATQVASVETVHWAPILCPATHVLQGVGAVAPAGQKLVPNVQFTGVEDAGLPQYLPAGHGRQTVLEVAVHGTAVYWPAEQTVQVLQAERPGDSE
jgi:hypothetical protein